MIILIDHCVTQAYDGGMNSSNANPGFDWGHLTWRREQEKKNKGD